MVVASLAIALLGMTPGKIDINLANFKDGDSISRPRTLSVTVDSSSPINQVEFYVGDSLRTSDSSTPYEFQIDPLNEPEGKLKLTFAAYSSAGENAKKAVTVTIDSGVSKGADANVAEGNDMLTKGSIDDAIYLGRVAMKAKEGHNPARLLLARAYLRKGIYDKAQNFAEDALRTDPNLDDANEVLSAISLRKGLLTLSGGNRKTTLEMIQSALKKGVAARRKVLDRQMEAAGPVTDANLIPWSKTAIRVGRYKAAINALGPVFRKTESGTEVGNLLAYAQIRNSNLSEAAYTIAGLERSKTMDGFSYALKAMLLTMMGKDSDSDAAMSEAIGNDPDSIAIKMAQTYIALKRNRIPALSSLVAGLAKDEGQRPEVNYYLSILLDRQQNYSDADKKFMEAILAEPTLTDILVERGNQAIAPVLANRVTDTEQKQYQIDLANAYYTAALEGKPDSAQALTGVMIYNAHLGKYNEALSFADAAIAAQPNYAAGQFAASVVYTAGQMKLDDQAQKLRKEGGVLSTEQLREVNRVEMQATDLKKKAEAARKKAAELDPTFIDGRVSPNLQTAYAYFAQHGRVALLVLP